MEVSFNVLKCFSAFVKIFPCGKFKKFKTNKAILTIVIERKESDNDENIPRKYFCPKEKKSSSNLFGDWYLAVVLNYWVDCLNISCKDGLDKGQKWYGPNRSRRY